LLKLRSTFSQSDATALFIRAIIKHTILHLLSLYKDVIGIFLSLPSLDVRAMIPALVRSACMNRFTQSQNMSQHRDQAFIAAVLICLLIIAVCLLPFFYNHFHLSFHILQLLIPCRQTL
jgi:hypothetical protein